MTTKMNSNTRKQGNGSDNQTNTKGEINMTNTTKKLDTAEFMAKMLEAMEVQTKAIAALSLEVETLKKANAQKSAPAPKKQAETEVQKPLKTRKIREEDAGKEVPVRTRKSASAKKPAPKPTDAAKERGLQVVKKFDTQMYLRVPRGDGNAEVAHINLKTKRGNCVASIHAKAEKADMGLIREFLMAYAEQLTYTKKLAQAGISKAADIAKATDATLLKAFGC